MFNSVNNPQSLGEYFEYCFIRWNPAKRPSAQQALRYPYFQSGTNKQPNGHIMEQTLQRSYARKSGMLHHQVTPAAINYSDISDSLYFPARGLWAGRGGGGGGGPEGEGRQVPSLLLPGCGLCPASHHPGQERRSARARGGSGARGVSSPGLQAAAPQ